MKTYFENPELEVIKFRVEDVITTSNGEYDEITDGDIEENL